MTLQQWLRNSWLIEHRSSKEEMASFLALADRDIQDAQAPQLSADWRFNIAYNAALQLASASLAAAGYRVNRGGSHNHYAIQSLEHTLQLDGRQIALLDRFRRKRNIAEYDAAGAISEQEAGEILALAQTLRDTFSQWLRDNHPELC